MQRVLCLAAGAGLLVASLAGCTESDDNGGGNNPAPTATASVKPADAESCAEAKATTMVAGLAIAGVSLTIQLKGKVESTESLNKILEQLSKAQTSAKDPQIKAVIDEYATTLGALKKQMETPGTDQAKLSSEVDATLARMEKAEAKLAALCLEPSASPDAADGTSSARAVACERHGDAFASLMLPFLEVGLGSTDSAALGDSIKKLHTAIDTYATELTSILGETSDAEMKAALTAQTAEVHKLKVEVSGAKDTKALVDLADSPTFEASTAKARSLCKS